MKGMIFERERHFVIHLCPLCGMQQESGSDTHVNTAEGNCPNYGKIWARQTIEVVPKDIYDFDAVVPLAELRELLAWLHDTSDNGHGQFCGCGRCIHIREVLKSTRTATEGKES
jgi:hypothetical protein